MARRVLIIRRGGELFYLEAVLLGLAAGYAVVAGLHWHWLWGIAAFLATVAGLCYLFFRSKVLMYLLGGACSLGWGVLVGWGAYTFDNHGRGGNLWAGLLAGAATVALSFWSHKRTFDRYTSPDVEVVDEL